MNESPFNLPGSRLVDKDHSVHQLWMANLLVVAQASDLSDNEMLGLSSHGVRVSNLRHAVDRSG